MCSFASLKIIFKTWFVVLMLGMNAVCEQVVHSIDGKVGGGNFTHYTLKQEGTVTLVLDSILGDADIYVSAENPKPDYIDYDFQSTTCGQDSITIPKDLKRPVGIAIYGHIYHPTSKYVLTVVLDYNWTVPSSERGAYYFKRVEHEESVVWVVFVNVMKIILELLIH